MSFLNPLAGTIAGQQLAQASLDAEKARQVRRAQAVSKNVAAANDRLEHEVESAEAIKPVDPNGHQSDPRKRKGRPKRQGPGAGNDIDGEPRLLDLKA